MDTPRAFDLATTFIRLDTEGVAEPVKVTTSFWSGSDAGAQNPGNRLAGIVDFRAPRDLHSETQEMHPEADEVLVVVSGALDLVVDGIDGERRVAVDAGQAAIVPRGTWHRLVMRRPGRLLFVNSRTGMRTRRVRREEITP